MEFGANKIGIITPAGTIDHKFPIPTSNAGAVAIVTGPDGNMWFTLANLGTVGKLVFQWLHLPLVERREIGGFNDRYLSKLIQAGRKVTTTEQALRVL